MVFQQSLHHTLSPGQRGEYGVNGGAGEGRGGGAQGASQGRLAFLGLLSRPRRAGGTVICHLVIMKAA